MTQAQNPLDHGEKNRFYAQMFNATDGIRPRPQSVAYLTPPQAYLDETGQDLIDSKTADPKSFTDARWVGILGSAQIEFLFATPQKINWVAAHVLHSSAAAIYFPSSLEIFCQANNSEKYKQVTVQVLPVQRKDSDYVFSNLKPIGQNCLKIKINLANDGWTFLSEVEFAP